ncbi:hypothetical protein NDU88_006270, partial [Pleurodeles waltl]
GRSPGELFIFLFRPPPDSHFLDDLARGGGSTLGTRDCVVCVVCVWGHHLGNGRPPKVGKICIGHLCP